MGIRKFYLSRILISSFTKGFRSFVKSFQRSSINDLQISFIFYLTLCFIIGQLFYRNPFLSEANIWITPSMYSILLLTLKQRTPVVKSSLTATAKPNNFKSPPPLLSPRFHKQNSHAVILFQKVKQKNSFHIKIVIFVIVDNQWSFHFSSLKRFILFIALFVPDSPK